MDQASSRSKLISPGRSSVDDATAAGTSSRAVCGPQHPFENSKKLLVLLPNDAIDAEAETRLFNELREATQSDDDDESYLQTLKRHETRTSLDSTQPTSRKSLRIPELGASSPELGKYETPASIFSDDIWLGDNSGASSLFARGVEIRGWTSVGDKLGGAYIVYECVVRTKEETVIHVHKRYNAFEELFNSLHRTLPRQEHRLIPPLPPKTSLAKYRSSFLEKRRRMLERWLSSVLLHPDLGGSQAVRNWLLN
ncbi:Phox-like protein [Thelephora terrestris]|uniref:Endosomal/vacuolar adapter protein YPT35 n=1 Tax=Thelephora terrestris TaxID=56493 RepID=A0A9P6HI66_9AGAM|nr:Phox-like protein [Thelephora terrestris]